MEHNLITGPALCRFWTFSQYWSDFLQPCAPPKTCQNQKSFWDPLHQPPTPQVLVAPFYFYARFFDDFSNHQPVFDWLYTHDPWPRVHWGAWWKKILNMSYQRRPSSRVAAEGLDQYKEHSWRHRTDTESCTLAPSSKCRKCHNF